LIDKRDKTMTEKVAGLICPRCGAKKLFRERLPDGRIEIMCLELDCNYTEVFEAEYYSDRPIENSFAGRVSSMSDSSLRQCEDKLQDSIRSLSGRAKRLASQQLSLVQAEIRSRMTNPVKETTESRNVRKGRPSAVPPQLNTPQAVAKRIAAIRNYHRGKKGVQSPLEMPNSLVSITATRWLDRLLQTLRDEADRHEQAAKNYARIPELFALHIEHSARSFELHRVLDLLENYVEILCEDEDAPEKNK
jgi:hypothetical protein